jgi:hypothetical protein
MSERPAISVLALRHRIPDDWAADPGAGVRPLIDGVDVLQEVHPEGLAPSRRHWAGPPAAWPLAAAEEPRRVMITAPVRTAGCRGAPYVTPRRAGDRVVWDSWENTSGGTAVPPAVHFDAAGTTPNSPVRPPTTAGRSRSTPSRGWSAPSPGAGGSSGGAASSWTSPPGGPNPASPRRPPAPGGVDVWFREGAGGGPGLYGYRLTTAPDRPADRQARWFAEHILADDARRTADVREG